MQAIVINFAHPLTPAQQARVSDLLQRPLKKIIGVPCQIDHQQPLTAQVVDLVDAVGFTPADWQQNLFLLNPPSLSAVAAAVLAEVHGRAGYFPSCLRLRPAEGGGFEVAEILDLAAVRDTARRRRHVS